MNRLIFICSLLLIFTAGISFAQIDKSLVAFWSFNDGNGDNAKDSSPNKFNGKLNGNPKWVDGKVGKALEFNGKDDYVEVVDIVTPTAITFACWFKKTGSGNGGVPRLHSRGTGPWSLEYGIGNTHQPKQLEFYLAFSDGSTTNWTPFFEPKDNTWYHTAITFDENALKTYVDGKETFSSKNWAGKKLNQGISRIGGHAAGGDCFQGIIDEVVLCNVALSEDDINSLMNGRWLSVQNQGKISLTWGEIKR